jgi:multidrug efflux pump subunit AcrB
MQSFIEKHWQAWDWHYVRNIVEFEYNLHISVAVFVISLVMMEHPTTALIVSMAIAMIDSWLFGLMWIFDIRVNSISVINLILAIGLGTINLHM